MIVEIVTTGSELLLGQIVNTNAAYMAKELNEIGFDVVYQTTVGDNRERMEEVISHALTRADIVITTGGLGPTRGDITKEVSSGVFGLPLLMNEEERERLECRFQKMGRPMTENNLRQAMIPEGAHIFVNHAGTAPGVAIERDKKLIVNLPGPPREMEDMFQRSLVPYLREKYGFSSVIVSRVLNTFGIGESMLETKIDDLILSQGNPTLALLARRTGVIVRLTAKAVTKEEAFSLIAPVEREILARVGEYIYAQDDAPIEEIIGTMLREKRLSIAAAESCTGGLFASRLTDVAGSSAYVKGGIVSYTNEVKRDGLGVSDDTLTRFGAVSEETAREMAKGVHERLGADIGVAITGLAGPDGGEGKPAGLVYIAADCGHATMTEKNFFGGTRGDVKFQATQAAFFMVMRLLRTL